MGIIIIEEDTQEVIVLDTTGVNFVAADTNDSLVIADAVTPVVISVLAGEQGVPGLQNVYVGNTEPSEPFEDMIWIDTSG